MHQKYKLEVNNMKYESPIVEGLNKMENGTIPNSTILIGTTLQILLIVPMVVLPKI